MQPRTRRQREILDYIATFLEERGHEPSYQQIARHFGIKSKSAVANHIAALEKQGLLSRQRENGSFGLQINPKDNLAESICEIQWLKMPFKDTLTEDFEDAPLYVPKFMLGYLSPEKIRGFRIRDDAMMNAHICAGDIALIEERTFARDGDVIVALIEKQKVAVIKYFRKGANVELRPANLNYDSICLSADKIAIRGVVRGLLRLIS